MNRQRQVYRVLSNAPCVHQVQQLFESCSLEDLSRHADCQDVGH